jgi:energy-coupling factor transporter ATP-binding protein EcfA2
MLTRAKIERFKCLHDVSVELGPFNVLIGPNDSGKSSFLQALGELRRWLVGGPRRFNQTRKAKPSIREWSESSEIWFGMGENRLELRVAAEVWGEPTHVNSERVAGLAAEGFTRISEPLILVPTEIAGPAARGTGALNDVIATRGRGAAAHLARVALGDRKHYDAIQQGLRDITKGRVREAIVGEDTGNGYPLSFRLYDDTVIPAADLSQGLLVFFAFLCIVHRDDAPAVLLVEEPENGVHPLRLHEIVHLLRTLTERGIQIIMTTHSPDLLNACKPEEVLVFRRPNPDSGTEIRRLPADFERRSMHSTMGEIWASSGEEGLLDMLPKVEPRIQAEG